MDQKQYDYRAIALYYIKHAIECEDARTAKNYITLSDALGLLTDSDLAKIDDRYVSMEVLARRYIIY